MEAQGSRQALSSPAEVGIKRSVLSVLLGLVLGFVGFFVAARSLKSTPQVVEIWPIAAAIAAMVLVWFIQGTVMALLARPRLESTKVLGMTRIYLQSQAAAAGTPFAGGELAYQLLELGRLGLPADLGGAVLTIKSVFNGAVLVIGAAVGVLFIRRVPFVGSSSGLPASNIKVLLGAIVTIAAAFTLVALVVRKRRRTLQSQEERPEERRTWQVNISVLREKMLDFLRHLRDSVVWIWRQEPRVVFACLGLTVLYWALYPLLGTLALRAAGWNGDDWSLVFLAQFVLFLVIPFAPTPGNSGAAEIAFVALMSDYVPDDALLGGMVIWRILNHYSELVLGAILAGRYIQEDIEFARQEFGEARQAFGVDSNSGSNSDFN